MADKNPQAVFGTYRADAALFLGTCLLAVISALTAPHYISSHLFLAALIALFDAPHVACGLYFKLKNSRKNPALYYKIVAIFLLSLIVCVGFAFFKLRYALIIFFAHLSVWHFVGQHQAWFKLSGKHFPYRTKTFVLVNNLTSFSATWLLIMASLCGDESYGWFGFNDLFLFPAGFKVPFLATAGLSLIAYFIIHLMLYIRTRIIMFSRHMVLMSMLVVWIFSRHVPDPYLRAALIFMPHSMIYFYLLFKVTPKADLPNFKIASAALTLIFGCFAFYVMTDTPVQSDAPFDGLSALIALTLAMSITHALADRLYWNSKDNPGWSKPLTDAA